MRLYDDLVRWYHLLDPPADHEEEAATYAAALDRAIRPRPETLLELGAGAGHNALYLKRRFRCTLTDVSPAMQARSRALNPECEHIPGDMRTLRLDRTFDAVFIHDAIVYMTSEDDLRAAARTAFAHTRPGGAAIVVPDCLRETFVEGAALHGGDDGPLALRCLEWSWDPDPADHTYTVEYALLLRDGTTMTSVHERHLEGLFSRATWTAVLASVGFAVEPTPRPPDEAALGDVFLCRRLG